MNSQKLNKGRGKKANSKVNIKFQNDKGLEVTELHRSNQEEQVRKANKRQHDKRKLSTIGEVTEMTQQSRDDDTVNINANFSQ